MCSDRQIRLTIMSLCAAVMFGCVPAPPQDLVSAIEALDQNLIALRAAESGSAEYAHFVEQWVSLRARLQSEDDVVRWPWESDNLEEALQRVYDEGTATLARLQEFQAAQRESVQTKLVLLEQRLEFIATQVDTIEGRIVLGDKPVEADLLLKQARSFYDQHDYTRALEAADRAGHALSAQTHVLTTELGRYADDARIIHWQRMVHATIEWSRTHRAPALVVSKADRLLTLYKNGHKVLSYPVRLGFNGIREKRHQGDGATPEGQYRITAKRGAEETRFSRALVLNYPNAEDRRRFDRAKRVGRLAPTATIGSHIEIHGVEYELMAQTLGCIMLDNPHMMTLFEHVSTGTPVTIVGALNGRNAVALALAHLEAQEEDT